MSLRLAINFRSVDPSRGGAETYVADLCRALVDRGHQVELFADSWAEGVLSSGVRCTRVPAHGRTTARRIESFAANSVAALRQHRHDCSIGFINTWSTDVLIPQGGVHEGSLQANAQRFRDGWMRGLYLAGKRSNPRHRLYRAIERRQYDPDHGARLVIAVSHMVREHLHRFHGVPPERVRVIPNAIDASRLAVAEPNRVRSDYRRSAGLAEDDLVALFVGHNFRLKGLGPLLQALRRRLDRDPSGRPIHALVCGGGRIAPFRKQVRRMGLERFVRLIGFAPDIRAVFHASDFFVLPTYYDPCSLVVFEALACGLPVITTRCNGAGDVMTEGREGFVISTPAAIDELADALDAMTRDEDRKRMSAAARELGSRQSFSSHVEKLEAVFREIAAARGAGAGSAA